MQELIKRNQYLEELTASLATQLSQATEELQKTKELLGHEVAERRRTENALLEEQLLSKSILESLPGIFYLYSYPELELILWNKEHESLLGYEDGEIKGRHVTSWHAPKFENDVLAAIDNVMSTGRASIEADLLTKSGEVLPFLLTGIRFESQGKRYLMGIGIEITEQKRAEAETEELQKQLTQAQKMDSIGRLAGGVAHDFNNMLSVIIGHTDLAMMQMEKSDPLYSRIERIKEAGERSADLTGQLLAFARKQTIAPKILDLNHSISEMIRMLQRLIGEDIELGWFPAEDVLSVKMDPGQINQILVNLCVNSRDSISNTGKITIETGIAVFDETYCTKHVYCKAGEYVFLAVSDTGCGMEAETLENIFEPFYTTKAAGKGTGLGLATVYGIVKQNNGFINAYSEVLQGTTMRVYLPYHPAEDLSELPLKANPPIQRGNETILVVEDEPAILELIEMMLQELGYSVISAGSPDQALLLARTCEQKIDLLVTDVIMPNMNGRDLAGEVLKLHPDIRCLYMSGYTANVIAHHGVLDDGVDFIPKPFSEQDLGKKIREILERM